MKHSPLSALLAISGLLAISNRPRAILSPPTPTPSPDPEPPDYEPVSPEAKAAMLGHTTEYGGPALRRMLARRMTSAEATQLRALPETQAALHEAAQVRRMRRALRKNPSAYSVRNAHAV